MDDDRIHDLIGTIYDAALEPRVWINVVNQLKTTTKSRHGHLWSGTSMMMFELCCPSAINTLRSRMTAFRLLNSKPSSYQVEDLQITDPHLDRASASSRRKSQPWAATSSHSMHFELQSTTTNSAGILGFFICLGGDDPQKEAVSALGLFRSEQDALYSDDEEKITRRISSARSSLIEFVSAAATAERESAVLQSSIDTLRSAIVLIDDTGKVVFLNAAADRLFKRCPEPCVRRGRLHAKSHADTVALEHLARRATGADGRRPIGGAVAIQRAGGGPPLQVIAAPVSADNRTMLYRQCACGGPGGDP